MSNVTKEIVLQQLSRVKGPDLQGDIVSLGLVSDVLVDDGNGSGARSTTWRGGRRGAFPQRSAGS